MQKLFQVTCLALASMALSNAAQAFTVENMSAWSTANQPLRMDIELADLAVVNANQVQVRVASEDEHARLGLTRPSWADGVRFQMISQPNNRVVARASTSEAMPDARVSFVVSISTPSEGRLQQVGSSLGQKPLASKNPAPERSVVAVAKQAAPQAKPYNPTVESISAPTLAAPAAHEVTHAAASSSAAPTPATKPVPAAKPAPATKPAPAPVAKPAPAKASVAPAKAAPLSDSSQNRTALEQGLKAAQAQVADLEAQIAALPAPAHSTPAPKAAAEPVASEPVVAATDAAPTDAAPAEELVVLDVEGVLPEDSGAEADAQNAQELAAATVASEQNIVEPEVTALKPYQLFARFMILVVGLILLVFFLIDKARNRR